MENKHRRGHDQNYVKRVIRLSFTQLTGWTHRSPRLLERHACKRGCFRQAGPNGNIIPVSHLRTIRLGGGARAREKCMLMPVPAM